MFLSRTLVIAGSVLVAAVGWLIVPAAAGRSLKVWEVLAIAAAALVVLLWQRRRQLRRLRQEVDSMRDSALW